MTSVLVVDDDADITANLADILSALGYDVVIANDAVSALESVQETHFDLAILDFKMPGMNGADLYAEIKRTQPHTVALMVTAYAGSNGAQQARDAGTWKVLRKPIEVNLLIEMLQQALDQPVLLIVDDDREFCESLWQVLRDRDLRVAFAHDETAAIARVQSSDYQMILLDVALGETTSGPVFEAVLEHGKVDRTIIVTGKRAATDPEVKQMLHLGALAVHYKPIEVAELIRSIEGTLGNRSPE
ncbi:MAG: response regulator [Planctomycetota bacterium]